MEQMDEEIMKNIECPIELMFNSKELPSQRVMQITNKNDFDVAYILRDPYAKDANKRIFVDRENGPINIIAAGNHRAIRVTLEKGDKLPVDAGLNLHIARFDMTKDTLADFWTPGMIENHPGKMIRIKETVVAGNRKESIPKPQPLKVVGDGHEPSTSSTESSDEDGTTPMTPPDVSDTFWNRILNDSRFWCAIGLVICIVLTMIFGHEVENKLYDWFRRRGSDERQ